MNYQDFVHRHRMSNADITVAALPCNEKQASAFGLMKIDDHGKILEFAEKPSGDALKAMQVDTTVLGLDAARYSTDREARSSNALSPQQMITSSFIGCWAFGEYRPSPPGKGGGEQTHTASTAHHTFVMPCATGAFSDLSAGHCVQSTASQLQYLQ